MKKIRKMIIMRHYRSIEIEITLINELEESVSYIRRCFLN